MVNFESPIVSKRVNTTSSFRELEVPDESGYSNQNFSYEEPVKQHRNIEEIERELREAQQAKRSGKEKLSDGAKRRIEMLLGMTQLKKEVKIENNTFLLRTLKSKEMRDALFAASSFDGTVQAPYEIRRQLLSRSIVEISGIDIESFLGTDKLDAKFAFVDDLDESFILRLYNEYLILAKESSDKFSIKNEIESQEVSEDLKK